eukprot:scaffold15655_cov165-Skeletonema_marinoi.AAC.3
MYGIQRDITATQDDISITSEDSETLKERLNSQLFVVRVSVDGKILSQFPMEESESIAANLVDGRNTSNRSSCMLFRSMLRPIPKEKVPVRDDVWLRRCMRGILVSAIGSADDVQEDWSSHYQGGRRPLSPEHVYCWFTENHGIMPEDEEVWSFYYCLKRLAGKLDAEACLHYQMLNNASASASLDCTAFFVDTIVYIQSLMDTDLDLETECQQHIWMPTSLTKQVISHMFTWTDPPIPIEELNRKAESLATRFESVKEKGRVDVFSFLQLLMNVHAGQIKKQTTLLRVLFETASKDDDVSVDIEKLVSLRELHDILEAVYEPITVKETTHLYRDAYDLLVAKTSIGYAPHGITFDSFLFAAKQKGLFTQIRRSRQKGETEL